MSAFDDVPGGGSGRAGTLLRWLAAQAAARGRAELSSAAIAALLAGLAARPGLTARADALRPPVGRRSWACLWRDDHVDVWLLAWTAGSDTGWHDHDSSSGAFRVLEGEVTQERPGWAGGPERLAVGAGGGLSFGPDHVHRLVVAGERAVSVHAYSPPLRRMGQYDLDPSGARRRRTISYDEELRAALTS